VRGREATAREGDSNKDRGGGPLLKSMAWHFGSQPRLQ